MIKASKVFIILGMIFQFYLIFPIIIGAFSLNNLKKAKVKNELISWGVVTIIFVSTLGGIFYLCIPQTALDKRNSIASVYDVDSKEIENK